MCTEVDVVYNWRPSHPSRKRSAGCQALKKTYLTTASLHSLAVSSYMQICRMPIAKNPKRACFIAIILCCLHRKLKGKSVPLQAWSGPEGSRRLRFPDFMTMAQDSGKVVSLTHRPPLPPGNAYGTHFC